VSSTTPGIVNEFSMVLEILRKLLRGPSFLGSSRLIRKIFSSSISLPLTNGSPKPDGRATALGLNDLRSLTIS